MRGGMDVLIDLVHRLLTFGKNIAPLFHDAQVPIKLAFHAESRAKPVPASRTHECPIWRHKYSALFCRYLGTIPIYIEDFVNQKTIC